MKYILIDKSGKHSYKVSRDEDFRLVVVADKGEYEIVVELVGEGARATILGLVLGKNKDEVLLNTEMIHRVGKTHGDTLVHGVMKGKSRAEIKGMIRIDEGALLVTDFLTEKILLVSDEARAIAEPSLEIKANEVRASHAATVSKIGEEELFYLMSRGLSEQEAEKIIVDGFLNYVVEKIEDVKIKEQIYARCK